MHFKVLLIVLLIILGDKTDAKRRTKKKSRNQIPTGKKTDSCCARNDVTLHTDLKEIKSNVTETRAATEQTKADVEEMKADIEKMITDAEETKTGVQEIKGDVEKIKGSAEETKTAFEEMNDDVEEIKADAKQTKSDVEEIKNSIAEMENTIDRIEALKNDMAAILDLLGTKQNTECETTAALPRDCSYNRNFTGVKIIQPKGQDSFRAYCSEGCVYIARRFNGSVDFYRDWVEYQDGFGSPDGEHFIGLDNLHGLLLQGNYKLQIDLTTWPPGTETRRAEYSIFGVGDARSNYKLTIGGYSGNASDSLDYHNGMAFTTKDRDHDELDSKNCAVEAIGAWWYKGCHYSNLFGFYNNGPECPSYADCTSWYNWPEKIGEPNNHYYSFKKADIKMCPI